MATASDDHPWIHLLDIDKLLQEHEVKDKSTRRREPSVYPVAPFIRSLKPEIYNASFLPLGLYNRDFKRVTAVDNLKLEVLICILAHLKVNQHGWKTFCKEVATQPSRSLTPDVEYFYEDDGSLSSLTLESAQSILVVDAFFIAALFIWRLEPETEEDGKWVSDDRPRFIWHIMKIFYRGSVGSSIHAFDLDICWLYEGQIPLFLIRNVWERIASVAEIDDFDFALRYNLRRTLINSGLLYKNPRDGDINFDTCENILECVHRSLSHWSSFDQGVEQEEGVSEDEKGQENDGKEKDVEANVREKDELMSHRSSFDQGGEQDEGEDDNGQENDGKEKKDVEPNVSEKDELKKDEGEIDGYQSRLRKLGIQSRLRKLGIQSRTRLRKLGIVSQFLKFAEKIVDFAKGVLSPGDFEFESRYSLPTAVELSKMGVRFIDADESLNDVKFEKSFSRLTATLKLPKLSVNDFTEKLLLNICVYESMNPKSDGVHEYLLLLDELIDSKEDVDLLIEGNNPVIKMSLGDNYRVAEIFSNPVQNINFFSDTDQRITDFILVQRAMEASETTYEPGNAMFTFISPGTEALN
ncbi:hypothetical protein R1sor_006958 [Riccia sorocarpa]|uniref:Uncharacterized protein n=1 Tax=Riccia sorocarpa TaxID=122646 RepID=A0ABD3HRY3_9MARC